MTNGYQPGPPFTPNSPYGYRNDPFTRERKFHSGQDYRAATGTPIPTAASGVVVYSGFNDKLGNVVIVKNDTGDYGLYAHLQDGDRAKLGQRIWPVDTIGLVGNTGERTTGPHLHYSIIRRDARGGVENPQLPHDGGPIGVALNEQNTIDPAGYDNYNPKPRYLDESKRAAEIMSGLDEKASRNGGIAPDRPGTPFFNPSNPAPAVGFVPRPGAPAASDAPASFADRFGSWAAQLGLGKVGAPAPQVAPSLGRRSELPNEEVPVTQSAWPLVTADASSLGGVLKYGVPDGTEMALPPADPNAPGLSSQATMGSDNVPARRLVGRVVNLSAPSTDAPPLVANRPTGSAANEPASPPPLLGIFSGKPMPDWPVRPSIFQPKDQASPDDDELFQRWMRWVDA